MKASRIISQARILLKDAAAVRWTDPELLGWLNGAQLQVVAVRPDANAKKVDLVLVAGVEQSIPAGGTRLLDVIRNAAGRAVTLIVRDQLSAFNPDWYTTAAATAVKHYLFDDSDPKSFEVYPPAIAGATLRVLYAAIPADCTALDSDIALDDIYEGPMIDWVCYRAWLKDGDATADASRAAGALGTFMQALGVKTQSDQATRPTRK